MQRPTTVTWCHLELRGCAMGLGETGDLRDRMGFDLGVVGGHDKG